MGTLYIAGSSGSGGGGTSNIQELTADGTVTGFDYWVQVNASTGNVKVTLPSSNLASTKCRCVIIQRLDNTNNVVSIVPSTATESIDGTVNGTIYLYAKGDVITLTSQGNGDCKITSDNRGGFGGTASFLRGQRTSQQTTGFGNDKPILFNSTSSVIGSNATLDTATGIITLKPNIEYNLLGSVGEVRLSNVGWIRYQWFNITANAYIGAGAGGDDNSSTTMVIASTVASATIKPTVETKVALQILNYNNLGGIGFNSNLPWFTVEEVSRQATIVNTVDYGFFRWSTNKSIPTVPFNLVPDVAVCGNIPLASDGIKLTAGKTYSIEYGLYGTWSGTSAVTFGSLYDVLTDTQLLNAPLFDINSTDAVAGSYSGQTQNKFLYTPPTNQTIKLKVTSSNNNCLIQCDRSWVSVTQVGSSGTSEIPANLVDTSSGFTAEGYTKLGTDAPAIKTKYLTATTGGALSTTSVAHGLTLSKIIGVQILVLNANSCLVSPSYSGSSDNYNYFINSTSVNISISNGATAVTNRPATVLITYME